MSTQSIRAYMNLSFKQFLLTLHAVKKEQVCDKRQLTKVALSIRSACILLRYIPSFDFEHFVTNLQAFSIILQQIHHKCKQSHKRNQITTRYGTSTTNPSSVKMSLGHTECALSSVHQCVVYMSTPYGAITHENMHFKELSIQMIKEAFTFSILKNDSINE